MASARDLLYPVGDPRGIPMRPLLGDAPTIIFPLGCFRLDTDPGAIQEGRVFFFNNKNNNVHYLEHTYTY